MSPNIISGDRILARKRLPQDRVTKRGDLIVYRNPLPTGARRIVGRVVAVAGDQIEIRGEHLLINGNELVHESVPDESSKALVQRSKGRVVYEVNSDRRYIVSHGDSSDGDHGEESEVECPLLGPSCPLLGPSVETGTATDRFTLQRTQNRPCVFCLSKAMISCYVVRRPDHPAAFNSNFKPRTLATASTLDRFASLPDSMSRIVPELGMDAAFATAYQVSP